MKLYYSPTTCSLAVHIALREAELPHELERVHLGSKKLKDGTDYLTVNAKGYVPALRTDDGEVLTEVAVLLQYVADHAPAKHLAPPTGTLGRYRLQETLNFLATEVHKGFSPLFNKELDDAAKAVLRGRLVARLRELDATLGAQPYLLGQEFSVADAYLFTVLGWCKWTGVDLAPLSNLGAFLSRVGERPAVKAALEVEKPKG